MPLQITPSKTTAAMAGAWSALGLTAFEWLDKGMKASASASTHNLMFAGALLMFLVLPCSVLVIGKGAGRTSLLWFLDKEERQRQHQAFGRMLVWFVFAGSVMLLLSLFTG